MEHRLHICVKVSQLQSQTGPATPLYVILQLGKLGDGAVKGLDPRSNSECVGKLGTELRTPVPHF